MLKSRIAVVFGGASNESEISVITGTMTANVLKDGGTDVTAVYISPSGGIFCGAELCDIGVFKRGEELKSPRCIVADGGLYVLGRRGRVKKFLPLHAAVNCCHGGLGEGGGVGGMFACAGIPMAGGDIFCGAAFIDKCRTKVLLSGLGVPVLPSFELRSKEDIPAAISAVGLPAIIKPACLGSSIGVARAGSAEEFLTAVQAAFAYDGKVLCEPCISDRREINCAAYFGREGITVSPCEEAFSSGGLLTFDDKYAGGGRSVIPADIPEELSRRVRALTEEVYSRLDMRGIVRFDYLLRGEELWLSEVNTVPGSLAWYLFAPSLRKFRRVVEEVTERAVRDFGEARSKLLVKTGILSSVPASSKLK